MPTMYGFLDLVKNELRNAAVQNLGSAPASPVKGQIYFDTASNTLYFWDGTTWQSTKASGASVGYGSVTAEQTFGTSKNDGVASTVARSDHAHGNPTHTQADHAGMTFPPSGTAGGGLSGTYPNPSIATTLNNIPAATGAINANSQLISNLATPVSGTDAANKNYVDTTAQGLDAKNSVRAATTANITLSGTQTIDNVILTVGDRVLVKNQTNAQDNGIYVVASGAWTRALDMDTWAEVPSAFTFVEVGSVNADTGWVCTADQGGSIGVTTMPWTQFSSAGAVVAGAGMTQAGNTLNVIAGDTSLTVNADELHVNTAVIATVASLASYAPLASPTFTGDPKAPTAAPGDNDTSIATTAFVAAAITAAGGTNAKKFAASLTGISSPEVITHNLNTRDIQLTVLNGASPYTVVELDWDATTVNTATIRYSPNLGAGYRAVVVG